MASGAVEDSTDHLNSSRRTENHKVYTRRRINKKALKTSNNNDSATTTAPPAADNTGAAASTTHNPTPTSPPTEVSSATAAAPTTAEVPSSTSQEPDVSATTSSPPTNPPPATAGNGDASDCVIQESPETPVAKNLKKQSPLQNLRESSHLSSENDLPNGGDIAEARSRVENNRDLMPVPPRIPSGNGPVNVNGVIKPLLTSRVDDRVIFMLARATPKNEIKMLRKKLNYELDQVKRLVEQLEAKDHHLASYNTHISYSNITNNTNHIGTQGGGNIGGYGHPQHQDVRANMVDRRALVRVNSDMGAVRNFEPRPYSRQLSVAVMVKNHMSSEYVEKEKRTPKANKLYRNSEFLLGKDRLPSESNKRSKKNNGQSFRFNKGKNQMFKSCDSLLQRLMKHKYGWVFNDPVDAHELGLGDYHVIIKHPMDLGTIKKRLAQNRYKSRRDFALDVRLVFRNAMTYNPKGQDVHIMAEQLLQTFEVKWAIVETEYKRDMLGGHLSERPHVGRTHVPKKPKAKDLDKRDMTYEEKQKLSTHLQSLPPEKLDAIVQIINKRSCALSQHEDEIEVDIDNVDTETLWELDRFVSNYKKSLSKHKRKAEIALQARSLSNQASLVMKQNHAVGEARIENAIEKNGSHPGVQGEKQGYNRSRSISSSSSSSDSGSSSSDSDSDSSSEDGSDVKG